MAEEERHCLEEKNLLRADLVAEEKRHQVELEKATAKFNLELKELTVQMETLRKLKDVEI